MSTQPNKEKPTFKLGRTNGVDLIPDPSAAAAPASAAKAMDAKEAPQDFTLLWSDDLKHSLAMVVSLIAKRASSRTGAAWSELWDHIEQTERQRDELLAALKEIAVNCEHYGSKRTTADWDFACVQNEEIAQVAIANVEKQS